ncbi:hypothetical protein Q8F57_037680 [Paraburkholderia terrae]|uniref:hypothetical protein n=1 Tax=Paraburkholderia terrae TaxID=311230 RepID=UPI00296A9937|nr:hypothetical protein [Paraburkholderia terrae]MDW3662001.1 hypothetical protein [Paraburkholderia terrae]
MHQGNTPAGRRKRIDPLKTIVDHDLLRIASDIHRLKQNEAYWKDVPVPTRPLGKLRGETAFQVGVFALPVLAYLVAGLHFGFAHALWGLPLCYAVFAVLEKTLLKAIMKKRQAEEDRDRGRYAFTKILGERLGLKPEEVTLEVVLKMATDFGILVLFGRNLSEEAKADVMTHAYEIADLAKRLDFVCAQLVETQHLQPAPTKTAPRSGTTSRRRPTAAVAAARDDEEASLFPAVNTITGLPMIHGTPYDVGGNLFGQGTVGHLN